MRIGIRPFGSRRSSQNQEDKLSQARSRSLDDHVPPLKQGEQIGGRAMATPGQPSTPPARPGSGRSASAQDVRALPTAPGLRHIQHASPFVLQPPLGHLDSIEGVLPPFSQNMLSQLSAAERSHALNPKKMNPYLQFMCGPLLRYDTVDTDGMWHGAALIVTADVGSTYDPYPSLKYRWDPAPSAHGTDLGPHPIDPMAQHYRKHEDGGQLAEPNVQEQRVEGTELYVYNGRSGTYTFWRFLIRIPLSDSDSETRIRYSINDGLEMDFFVPGRRQTMRAAAYSCNGFSAGVNPDDFRGPGFQSGYDPLWVDLLAKHAKQPFHLLIGGGDQLYCDGIVREPELQEWVTLRKKKDKSNYPLTRDILEAIDRFYFNHYCLSFRSGAFARANSSIPMLNMLDDHDLIDGFGSYADELQKAPVFKAIGSRGYLFFLLFQCFVNVDKDGIHELSHPFKSTVIGVRGEYIPYPSHSILTPIGPTAWLLMLDCRAERKLGQICSEEHYTRIFKRMNALPPGVEHLIVQLGVPIVYPRVTLLKSTLSSTSKPLTPIRFILNKDEELLDDLKNDCWTSKRNMRERNGFIERLQQYALSRRIRISFLTGDVHCASVGLFKTLSKGKISSELSPESDYRYMLNVVSSAIVNAPPPNGVLSLVSSLSTKRNKDLDHTDTDEEMMPLFDKDTDGTSKPKSLYIMGRRNWCCITLEQPSGNLVFDIRVEKEKGHGETVGYRIPAPPPRWTARADE